MDFKPSLDFARQLDAQDPLAPYRSQFVIADPDLIYLDGNSLGRLPLRTVERLQTVVERDWGHELIRGWNRDWWHSPGRVGDKVGQLVGAAAGQTLVCDSTSINLFKLTLSALAMRPDRRRIATDTLNFPSDLYILQGCAKLLGGRHEIVRIGSKDNDISPDLDALFAAIDETTALVTVSHVLFKSGYLYDMAALTEHAHRQGALVLWDLSHSVSTVPMELDRWGVDFAIGCTYKYLNGGPGSPAFLYVRKDLQSQSLSPIWGWWGQKTPFAFDLDYEPTPGISRFLVGSQPILSLLAMEASLDLLLEAGMDRLRNKSVMQTEYLIALADRILAPLGFILGSPREAQRRGSHVSLRHPEGYRINRAMSEEVNVIPDFREPDNLRLGLAPLYTTYAEIWEAVERVRRVVAEKRYMKFPIERLTVT